MSALWEDRHLSFATQHAMETCGTFLWVLDESDEIVMTNAPVRDAGRMQSVFQGGRITCSSQGFPFFWQEEGAVFYVAMASQEGRMIFLGPMTAESLTQEVELSYANTHGLEAEALHIPSVTAMQAVNCAVTVCYLMTDMMHSNQTVLHVNKIISDLFTHQWIEYRMEAQNVDRLPYEYEQIWMDRVFSDSSYYAEESPHSMPKQPIGKLAESDFKQQEYQTVAALTLISRGAIRYGLSAKESYILSDTFFQELEKCKTSAEIQRVYHRAMRSFGGMVRYWQENRSPGSIAEQCRQYVDSHLYDVLTLEKISDILGVSKNHLSTLFTRENGQTLTNYIHEKRLDRASELLRYTASPIGDIAQQLMFSSQSHFGQLFKAHFGITPQKYRNKYGLHPANA